MKKTLLLVLLLLGISAVVKAQVNINLYEQFNGRYDFTFVGNTLNTEENGVTGPCTILTQSSANLSLNNGDRILKAYLYWAGSGTGDFDIKVNGANVTSQRNFAAVYTANEQDCTGCPIYTHNYDFFSAYADITSIVQAQGSGSYTISDLDLTGIINTNTTEINFYCRRGLNFGGWAIAIVVENDNLPLNQLNLYDGLQYVPSAINVSLPSLNVIDNEGAKIGFLAWEGDAEIRVNETLRINGNILSNPPLNPDNNAFNGTNSVTRSDTLYNMDLDIYEIQNYIRVGDATADISLTSGQDFVMVNAIMTKLNSQLPDATITVENIDKQCNSRSMNVHYTVHNVNSTDVLPAGTQVGVYVNGTLLTTFSTTVALPIGGSTSGIITLTIPAAYGEEFELLFVVDYNFAQNETDETNNSLNLNENLWYQANVIPGNITACETAPGSQQGLFDFSAYTESLKDDPTDVVTFYTSMDDARAPRNAIGNITSYPSGPGVTTIYVRVEDAYGCIGYGSFQLFVDDCLYPDAVIRADNIAQTCGSRSITLTYTVSNPNGRDVLPAGTPIGFYANSVLLGTAVTSVELPVDGSTTATITLNIPVGIPLDFTLILRVDNGNTVQELIETNNSFTLPVSLWVAPALPASIPNITGCETGNGTNIGVFDFSQYEVSLKDEPTDVVKFYTSQLDAEAGGNNNIQDPSAYTSNGTNPQQIYVRLTDVNGCYTIGTFSLNAIDCLFPDGVIAINGLVQSCDSRDVVVQYTVSNPNSFDILPAGTSIAIYANATLLTTTQTTVDIAINASVTQTINLSIPLNFGLDVQLEFIIDDNGTGIGSVQETIETNNNSNIFPLRLWVSPILQQPADVEACETFNGSGVGSFNFSAYLQSLKNNTTDTITFHPTQADADNGTAAIDTPGAYVVAPGTQVFVRLQDEHGCYDIKMFTLTIIDCYFPDGTVVVEDVYKQCNSRIIHVHYTVNNFNATDLLPAGTPVSIYVNGVFLDYTETLENIAIGGSESNYITLTIPVGVPLDFNLTFVVDDTGDGTGTVVETDETNNGNTLPTFLVLSPVITQPDDIILCDQGFGIATFDFSAYAESLKNYPTEAVSFYFSQQAADQDIDRIYNTSLFTTTQNPQRIYVRLDNGTCHTTASFLLRTKKCAPITYNYVTPNGDGYNDTFFVEGLRNIFMNFKMSIYNRWGNLVWTGNHSQPDWDAIATEDKVGSQDTTVPNSTYYFVLELNDPDFPKPITGWVYVTM